jgi:hypothetical protein
MVKKLYYYSSHYFRAIDDDQVPMHFPLYSPSCPHDKIWRIKQSGDCGNPVQEISEPFVDSGVLMSEGGQNGQ